MHVIDDVALDGPGAQLERRAGGFAVKADSLLLRPAIGVSWFGADESARWVVPVNPLRSAADAEDEAVAS